MYMRERNTSAKNLSGTLFVTRDRSRSRGRRHVELCFDRAREAFDFDSASRIHSNRRTRSRNRSRIRLSAEVANHRTQKDADRHRLREKRNFPKLSVEVSVACCKPVTRRCRVSDLSRPARKLTSSRKHRFQPKGRR